MQEVSTSLAKKPRLFRVKIAKVNFLHTSPTFKKVARRAILMLGCTMENSTNNFIFGTAKNLKSFLFITMYEAPSFQDVLRLGAQSFTLLNTLRDPTQLRRRQWATRQNTSFLVAHCCLQKNN